MSPKYAIGIDFGTESGRALLVDVADGREIATAVHAYGNGVIDEQLPDSNVRLEPDWALQDPNDYIEVLKRTVPAVLRQSGVDPADVIGIGIDFTACTMLPTQRDGTPLAHPDGTGLRRRAAGRGQITLEQRPPPSRLHGECPRRNRVIELGREVLVQPCHQARRQRSRRRIPSTSYIGRPPELVASDARRMIRERHVVVRRRWVAAWMVVDEHEPRGVQAHDRNEEVTRGDCRAVAASFGEQNHGSDFHAPVQRDTEQDFGLECREAEREMAQDIRGAADSRQRRALQQLPELARGHDAIGRGTGNARELFELTCGQRVDAVFADGLEDDSSRRMPRNPRKRAIEGVGAAMRADGVAVGSGIDGADHRSAFARGRRAPADRETSGRPVARVRGETDMPVPVRGHQIAPQKQKALFRSGRASGFKDR